MKIGEQIRALRKSENLTQDQLGQKLNVTRQAIYKWESGKGYPDIQNLIMLSELFEVSIDELIKGDRFYQRNIKVKGGTGMFSNRSLLSSLNYFSLFFAPLIFPLITLIVGSKDIKKHGKRALISQLIPAVAYVLMMSVFSLTAYIAGVNEPHSFIVTSGIVTIILIVVSIVVWNVMQGVKQLRS